MDLIMSATLEQAIQTALGAIEIDKQIVKEEYRTGFTITKQKSPWSDGSGAYRVFQDTAWTPQTESLLPWSAPTGTPVAHVALDGAVTDL